jgi:hypothetical protein
MTAFGTVGAVIAAVGIALWSDWRARKERRLASEREHLAEAYAVQVVFLQGQARPNEQRLMSFIINHGAHTITRVEAQFSPDGTRMITPVSQNRLSALSSLPKAVLAHGQGLETADTAARTVAPWDAGIVITTDVIPGRLTDPSAVVRWTDRWGIRWEYKRGDVRHVKDEEPWVAPAEESGTA